MEIKFWNERYFSHAKLSEFIFRMVLCHYGTHKTQSSWYTEGYPTQKFMDFFFTEFFTTYFQTCLGAFVILGLLEDTLIILSLSIEYRCELSVSFTLTSQVS